MKHSFPNLNAFFLIVFLAISLTGEAFAASPSNVVERFQASLLEVMKVADTKTVQQRYDLLRPSVEKSFHIPLMIQIASSGYWKESTKTQRRQLVDAFRRMSISTLATLFAGYDGEVFKLVEEKPGPQKTTLVMTKLIKADTSAVEIAYVTRSFKTGWRIIDVIVDNGISELMVRRSEYRQTLKKQGVPGLIALLNGKANELVSK